MKSLLMVAASLLTTVAGLVQGQQPTAVERYASPQIQRCFEGDQIGEKLTEIRRLIDVSGVFDMRQSADSIFEQLRPFMDEVDPERSDRLKEFEAKFFDMVLSQFDARACEMTKELIPVYDELFTTEEVRGLIRFYESPLGRRYVEARPTLSARSVALGQEVMLEILPAVVAELAKEFPEVMQQHMRFTSPR